MAKKEFKRIIRPATAEERARHGEIRAKMMQEFPPAQGASRHAGRSPSARLAAGIGRREGVRSGEVRFKSEGMGLDPPGPSRLETGKMLNPTLATLPQWAEALGRRVEVGLLSR